jgi:hypothetical protein
MWFVATATGAPRNASDSKCTKASPSRSTTVARDVRPRHPQKLTVRERQEYLALLARWYYSTWREGEWLSFDSYDDIPYRKLVNAVSRVPALPPRALWP